MRFTNYCLVRLAIATLTTVLTTSSVNAAHYVFSQGGFSGTLSLNGKNLKRFTSGRISGSFDAEDILDKNGNPGSDGLIYGLNDAPNEISNFSLKFSGNPHFDSMFSLDGIPVDGQYVLYDIKNKKLIIDLYWEGSYQADHASSLTGDQYDDFVGFTNLRLNLDDSTNKFFSGVVYAQGYDKQGNEIIGSRDLNINMTSSESTKVTIAHAPLPGTFGLFCGAISVLGLMCFRKFGQRLAI